MSGGDAARVRQRLVADWWSAGEPDGSLMIAHRRVDVADLNGRAHALMRAAGALGPDELRVERCRLLRRRPRGAAPQRALAGRGQRRSRDGGRARSGGEEAHGEIRGRVASRSAGAIWSPSTAMVAPRSSSARRSPVISRRASRAGGRSCSRPTSSPASGAMSRSAVGSSPTVFTSSRATPTSGSSTRPAAGPSRDARAALVAGLGRSGAQRLATDHAPAAAELIRVVKELAEAERARSDATAEQWRLGRQRPRWFRPAARREHAEALVRARAATDELTARAARLRDRQAALLEADRERVAPRRVQRARSIGREL